jgi:hypothetical protein
VVGLALAVTVCGSTQSTYNRQREPLAFKSFLSGRYVPITLRGPYCLQPATTEELVLGTSRESTPGDRSERAAREAKGGCEHRGYPIVVDSEGGGRRALCLGCGAAGPIRPDTEEAREALLAMGA